MIQTFTFNQWIDKFDRDWSNIRETEIIPPDKDEPNPQGNTKHIHEQIYTTSGRVLSLLVSSLLLHQKCD